MSLIIKTLLLWPRPRRLLLPDFFWTLFYSSLGLMFLLLNEKNKWAQLIWQGNLIFFLSLKIRFRILVNHGRRRRRPEPGRQLDADPRSESDFPKRYGKFRTEASAAQRHAPDLARGKYSRSLKVVYSCSMSCDWPTALPVEYFNSMTDAKQLKASCVRGCRRAYFSAGMAFHISIGLLDSVKGW